VRAFEVADTAGKSVPFVRLSISERRVLSLLVRCRVPKEIGLILGVSPGTVRSVLNSLRTGLDCHTQSELVRWCSTYPAALGGTAVPKMLHPTGCTCSAPYCRLIA
jgi:DNA-binding CsgD family transcriptional regulator